jgi:hypothetical protein
VARARHPDVIGHQVRALISAEGAQRKRWFKEYSTGICCKRHVGTVAKV